MRPKIRWQKILDQDILFQQHEEQLSKFIDVDKTANFFINSQTKEGYFYFNSPMFYNTYLFSGILHNLNKRPSKNTIYYIKSLQTGSAGFGEMPGEMPWVDRTVHALRMFKWFNLKPKCIKEIIAFHQKLHNNDGGFGCTAIEQSYQNATFDVTEILHTLKTKPRNINKEIDWLKKHIQLDNLYLVFKFVKTLIQVNYKFSENEKIELKNKSFQIFIRSDKSLDKIYYFLKILQLLKFNINIYQYLLFNLENQLKNDSHIYDNILNIFFISKIFNLFTQENKIKNKLLPFVKKFEVKQGGYYLPNEIYIFKNNSAFHTLFLLNRLNENIIEKYINWLSSVANNDGWGGLPNTPTDRDLYTTSSLLVYKLVGIDRLDQNLKNVIIKKIHNGIDDVLNAGSYSNYTYLRFFKEVMETLMILEEDINLEKIERMISIALKFQNGDGGFGHPKVSSIYTTYLTVQAIDIAQKYLEINEPSIDNKKISKWINSCQNKDGGFGSAPNQFSNIQATFYALRSLWCLNNECKNVQKAIKWILDCQNVDGGFSQNKNLISDLLISFYAIGSLVLFANKNSKLKRFKYRK